MSCAVEVIEFEGVGGIDALFQVLGKVGGQGSIRGVEIPVGVVGGKHEEGFGANHFEEVVEEFGVWRVFHRLCGGAAVFQGVFAGEALKLGDFASQTFVVFVKAPHQGRQPAKAAFEQADSSAGEGFKNAFADQADELGFKGLGHSGMVFDVVRRPADCGNGVSTTSKVNAHREVDFLSGFEDGMKLAAAVRGVGSDE